MTDLRGSCLDCGTPCRRRNARCQACFVVTLRAPRRDALERFWEKVDRRVDECWPWLAARSPGGYGQWSRVSRTHEPAHRTAYELLVGPIPEGLTLDHLCRNRSCVNPAHLEPVTNRENILRGVSPSATNARKTHCPKGHEYTPENTYRQANNGRVCRTCTKEHTAARAVRERLARHELRRGQLDTPLVWPVPR